MEKAPGNSTKWLFPGVLKGFFFNNPQQVFRSLGDGGGACGNHVLRFSVAPGSADSRNAVGGGTDHVESGVTDHDAVFLAGIQTQKIGNHVFFGGSGLIYTGTADFRKIPGKIEVLQNLPRGDLRLGSGDIQLSALGTQNFQNLPDAGIGRVSNFPMGT